MRRVRLLTCGVALIFLGGCAQMSYRQKVAASSALTCAFVGGAGGAIGAHHSSGHDTSEGQGVAIGAVSGALLCGTLGYLLAEEPKPPPPPPPPPPPAPRVQPPPPPPPPPRPPEPVRPPRVERSIILDHVLFDFDKSAIRPDGVKILDRLVTFLNENPGRSVDVEGHTDWIGTDQYNQGLSQRRADSVKKYLVGKGISAERVATRGFGESKPIADNRNKDGRARNRRVEVRVR